MPAFVADVRDTMIDWLTGLTTPAAVATRYITTYNGDPQGAGSENIATITGSANRIDVTAAMAASSGGNAANDTDIVFTASAAGSAVVDFLAIFDAITGGNLLASTAVTSKSVTTGDSLSITTGNLTFAIT